MKQLSFAAQLSLDFIYGGVPSAPDPGTEVAAQWFDIQLGGGTLVYPIVLTRLGIPCHVLIHRSHSLHADVAAGLLDTYGIETVEYLETGDFDAVMCTAVLTLPEERSFVVHNDPRALTFPDSLLLDRQKGREIVFAMEQNASILPQLKKAGSCIVFDIGWRDDLDLEQFGHILPYVDYFTPNEKEALALTQTRDVVESLAILRRFVPHPVISCGAKGCLTLYEGKVLRIPVPENIQSVDTTGAGDNFMAGLMYGLYHHLDEVACLKFAVAAGSLSTTGPGCYGCSYTADQVLTLSASLQPEWLSDRTV